MERSATPLGSLHPRFSVALHTSTGLHVESWHSVLRATAWPRAHKDTLTRIQPSCASEHAQGVLAFSCVRCRLLDTSMLALLSSRWLGAASTTCACSMTLRWCRRFWRSLGRSYACFCKGSRWVAAQAGRRRASLLETRPDSCRRAAYIVGVRRCNLCCAQRGCDL